MIFFHVLYMINGPPSMISSLWQSLSALAALGLIMTSRAANAWPLIKCNALPCYFYNENHSNTHAADVKLSCGKGVIM